MKKIIKIILPVFFILNSLLSTETISIARKNYNGERIQRASEYLMFFANQSWIRNYEDGNKYDMYTFDTDSYFQEYRYIGNDVNNYVYFNCSNSDNLNTCEIWRIIGVFYIEDEFGNHNYRIKLMKNEVLNSNYLSDDYWYTIHSKYQNMIESVVIDNKIINRFDVTNNEDYQKSFDLGINNPNNSWLDNNIYPVVYLKYDVVIESGNGNLNDAYVINSMYNSNYQTEEELLESKEYDEKNIIDIDDTGRSASKIIIFSCIFLIIIGGIIYIKIKIIKKK